MHFELSETQQDIKKAAREFAEKEFDFDLAMTFEKEGRFPSSIHEKACRLGFIGIDYPEEYGGQNFGFFENILVTEEFVKKDSGIGIAITLSDIPSCLIMKFGNNDQKKRFLIPITQGKSISTISQISLNGDRASISFSKTTSGDYEILNGKIWAIHASVANFILIICERPYPQKSISFLVKMDSKGVSLSAPKEFMGLKISRAYEIILDKVYIPKEDLISSESENEDPLITFKNFSLIKTSSQAIGIAQSAFDQALKHAREREQFGKKIIQFQGIQFMLADLYTTIEAARGLVYQAAHSYDTNDKGLERMASITKIFSTEVAIRTTIDSIQIHGGVGLMKDYAIERMLRDAKTIQNLFGSNILEKARIGRSFIGQ